MTHLNKKSIFNSKIFLTMMVGGIGSVFFLYQNCSPNSYAVVPSTTGSQDLQPISTDTTKGDTLPVDSSSCVSGVFEWKVGNFSCRARYENLKDQLNVTVIEDKVLPTTGKVSLACVSGKVQALEQETKYCIETKSVSLVQSRPYLDKDIITIADRRATIYLGETYNAAYWQPNVTTGMGQFLFYCLQKVNDPNAPCGSADPAAVLTEAQKKNYHVSLLTPPTAADAAAGWSVNAPVIPLGGVPVREIAGSGFLVWGGYPEVEASKLNMKFAPIGTYPVKRTTSFATRKSYNPSAFEIITPPLIGLIALPTETAVVVDFTLPYVMGLPAMTDFEIFIRSGRTTTDITVSKVTSKGPGLISLAANGTPLAGTLHPQITFSNLIAKHMISTRLPEFDVQTNLSKEFVAPNFSSSTNFYSGSSASALICAETINYLNYPSLSTSQGCTWDTVMRNWMCSGCSRQNIYDGDGNLTGTGYGGTCQEATFCARSSGAVSPSMKMYFACRTSIRPNALSGLIPYDFGFGPSNPERQCAYSIGEANSVDGGSQIPVAQWPLWARPPQ